MFHKFIPLNLFCVLLDTIIPSNFEIILQSIGYERFINVIIYNNNMVLFSVPSWRMYNHKFLVHIIKKVFLELEKWFQTISQYLLQR